MFKCRSILVPLLGTTENENMSLLKVKDIPVTGHGGP
jgi:hypothetical protein